MIITAILLSVIIYLLITIIQNQVTQMKNQVLISKIIEKSINILEEINKL